MCSSLLMTQGVAVVMDKCSQDGTHAAMVCTVVEVVVDTETGSKQWRYEHDSCEKSRGAGCVRLPAIGEDFWPEPTSLPA